MVMGFDKFLILAQSFLFDDTIAIMKNTNYSFTNRLNILGKLGFLFKKFKSTRSSNRNRAYFFIEICRMFPLTMHLKKCVQIFFINIFLNFISTE